VIPYGTLPDGRQAHIFNPSSFTLAVFSLALLLTGKSELTRGQDIASTQFYPPHIYLMLFLVGRNKENVNVRAIFE